MPSKKAQDEEEDHAVSSISRRKSTRMTSKNDGTPSRAESNATSASSAPTPRLNAKKSASVESDASSAITPSRRSKKGDSVEPSTPRRTSARLSSMSENPENAVELLELPAPRRRNSSTSSMGSVTTPRRGTRTAVKALPVLEEVEVIEDEGVKTPPKEAQELAPEVPASAQKRYANLASNLVKMVNSPMKMKTVLEVEEDEEITVLPVEKNAAKKESPKKAESPAKAASPKKETSKATVIPKKRDSPQKKSDEVEEEEEDEPMDWEAGPQKTPIMHHPKPQTKSTGVRMEQLVKDAQDTPRAVRAARRERPSSAVIFGVQEEKKDVEVVVLEDDDDVLPDVIATPAKKTASPVKTPQKTTVSPKISPTKADKGEKNVATPKKAPVKVVEEEEEEDEEDEVEVIDDEEEVSDEDDDLKELIEMEEDEEEEDEEEEEKEVQVAKSPKKTEKMQKVTEEEEEEEEQLDEDMEEDDEDEEGDEEEEEEEEEDYVGEDGTFPAVSFGKVFDGSVDFHAALESVYAWAFARGSSRVDDLPGRLVAAVDAETVWQQIEHRNAQITKDCKKAKKAGLLEKTITLTEVEKGEKKGKGKKRTAEEDDEEDEEEDVEFDDEDRLMDEDEEEDGEEMDDEEDEGEGNLFDMTEEELSRLDEDLKAMEADGDEEEEEEEERPRKKKEQQEKKKKFPKSAVDDRFFSLAEMEAAADAMEKDGAIEEGILDDGEEEGDAAYTYDEFFGADDDDVFGGKKKGRKPMDDDSVAVSKKTAKTEKSVSWADGSGKELRQERLIEPTGKMRRLTAAALSGEEEEEEEGQKEETEETEERILLGPADEEEKEQKTPLKGSIKSIKSRIAQLEEENLETRKWDLQGEVGGAQRGENTLLEQHVEFDHGMTRAPTITEDFNEKIEAIVLQRFKDKAWDDPVRTVRQEERTDEYRNKLVDEDLLIKQSLSSVYEKEYEKAQEGADASSATPAVNPKHAEIDEAWTELFGLIDPLFHFNVTPQQAKAEVKVITNVRALQQEEVGAMMSTEEMLIAPEEVKKREKGTLKGKEERDTTDKKRERRKKKQKQRAVLETRGEEGLKRMLEKKDETDDNGEPKKKKKKKNPDGVIAPSTSSGGKFKSTDFFTKLQATVQNELVEKTKKAKVKSATKGNSAKFKL